MITSRCGRAAARVMAVLVFGAVGGAPVPGRAQAAPTELDAATFGRIVGDLESDHFPTRLAATERLKRYADPTSATRLSTGQLQTLRDLARRAPLERASRAGAVLRAWVNKNPNTLAPADAVLSGIQVKWQEHDPVSQEGKFSVGSFSVSYQGVGAQVGLDLESRFIGAQRELGAGFTGNVGDRVKAMKKVVDDLTENDLRNLVIRNGVNEAMRADLAQALENAVNASERLMQKINESIGDPPPAPAPKIDVPGMGVIDVGKTLQLTLAGPGLMPGSLTLAMLPPELAIGTPPAGKAFFGYVFDLVAADGLALAAGSTVTVGIVYGGLSGGLSGAVPSQLQLVHLANGAFVPFDAVLNAQGSGVITGTYTVPSSSSGADQFGEFALVTPTPDLPPALLLISGAAGLLVLRRTRLAAQESREKRSAT